MLTLFHSPNSRSTAILSLIAEMGIEDRIALRQVTIPRMDGSGARDPANPHPEGKVPALMHDGQVITERAAIMLHLTSLFPEAGLAPRIGTADWGRFAGWMAWYQGVLEPTFLLEGAGVTHPWLTAAMRDHATAAQRLSAALKQGPWIMGQDFTAADILLHGPYVWFPAGMPDDPLIRDWVARCAARPASQRARQADAARMAALAA